MSDLSFNVKILADRKIDIRQRKFAGTQGDYKSCTITFDVSEIYTPSSSNVKFQVEWFGCADTYSKTILLEVGDDKTVSAEVPQEILDVGGTATVYLNEVKVENDKVQQIICSYPLRLYLGNKATGNNSVAVGEYNRNVTDMYLAVVNAKEDCTELVDKASKFASKAENSKKSAENYKTQAKTQADIAKSYAVGGTGSRENEDTDNAKYYAQEAKAQVEKTKADLDNKQDKLTTENPLSIEQGGTGATTTAGARANIGAASKDDLEAVETNLSSKADKTDLDSYATKTELNAKADKTELNSYATKTELNAKADKTEVANSYATKTELEVVETNLETVETELRNKADKTELNSYATKTEVTEGLNGKQDKFILSDDGALEFIYDDNNILRIKSNATIVPNPDKDGSLDVQIEQGKGLRKSVDGDYLEVDTDIIQRKLTAGDGIDITGKKISVDTDIVQEKLTAGTGIDIINNVISANGNVPMTENAIDTGEYPRFAITLQTSNNATELYTVIGVIGEKINIHRSECTDPFYENETLTLGDDGKGYVTTFGAVSVTIESERSFKVQYEITRETYMANYQKKLTSGPDISITNDNTISLKLKHTNSGLKINTVGQPPEKGLCVDTNVIATKEDLEAKADKEGDYEVVYETTLTEATQNIVADNLNLKKAIIYISVPEATGTASLYIRINGSSSSDGKQIGFANDVIKTSAQSTKITIQKSNGVIMADWVVCATSSALGQVRGYALEKFDYKTVDNIESIHLASTSGTYIFPVGTTFKIKGVEA